MSTIQSVIFQKSKWNSDTARTWLQKHRLKRIKIVDITKNTLRYRIQAPELFKRFVSKKINTRGITLILGFRN